LSFASTKSSSAAAATGAAFGLAGGVAFLGDFGVGIFGAGISFGFSTSFFFGEGGGGVAAFGFAGGVAFFASFFGDFGGDLGVGGACVGSSLFPCSLVSVCFCS